MYYWLRWPVLFFLIKEIEEKVLRFTLDFLFFWKNPPLVSSERVLSRMACVVCLCVD